jgi:hypothetical protein
MPGIIAGALGGAGDAMVKFGLQQQNAANAMDLENLRSQNDVNRAKAVEQAKIDFANQERTNMVSRVDAAAAPIVAQAKTSKLNTFYGDGSDLKPEDISDEEMNSQTAQLSDAEQSKARTQAAISPKEAAILSGKDAAAETQMTIAQLRMDAINARTQAQYETAMAKVEAMLAKNGSKAQTNKEALSFIDGLRKDVASEAANLKALYTAEIKDKPRAKVAEIEAAYKPKFAALEKRRAQIQQDFNSIRERVGLPAVSDEEESAPQPVAGDNPGKVLNFDPATGTFK